MMIDEALVAHITSTLGFKFVSLDWLEKMMLWL